MTLNQQTFNQIVNLLVEYMSDERNRQATVTQSLYGCAVLRDLDWTGGARPFTVHLIERLDSYGNCNDGELSIVTLLKAWRENVGVDKKREIDEIVAGLTALPTVLPTEQAPATPVALSGILSDPFTWCFIPTGKVKLGFSEWNHALHSFRVLKHTNVDVNSFYLAKYSITNAQFRIFENAPDGYSQLQWWDYSSSAREWRGEHPQAELSEFSGDNHPRTNVCWYKSVAFCFWLSSKVSEKAGNISLPTEAQWQRAAFGDENTAYPWGNNFSLARCNMANHNSGTVPVTQYDFDAHSPLSGLSPFGVADMAGNVWEWSLSESEYTDRAIKGSGLRGLRGGSWRDTHYKAQPQSHFMQLRFNRERDLGFRLAWVPK